MRIFIADDQSSVRSALCCLLEQQPGLTVVGEASDWRQALARLRACQPDVLLLDWELPGLAAHRAARLALPPVKTIVLSSRPEAQRAALEAGAAAFVSKSDAPEHLLAALRALAGAHPGAAAAPTGDTPIPPRPAS